MGWVPLREMAQLACLNQELHGVYLDRAKQRDAVLASLLESHFTPDFRKGLLCIQTTCTPMALPRDLIVNPPVGPLALCSWALTDHVLQTGQS